MKIVWWITNSILVTETLMQIDKKKHTEKQSKGGEDGAYATLLCVIHTATE